MKQLLLSDDELTSMAGLLDVAVKTLGLRACHDTSALIRRMEAATEYVEPAPVAETIPTAPDPSVRSPKPRKPRKPQALT